MTEAEWLDGGDPKGMLEFLRDRASDRKFRLSGAACCRAIWDTEGAPGPITRAYPSAAAPGR
jgi:hypothetical protein